MVIWTNQKNGVNGWAVVDGRKTSVSMTIVGRTMWDDRKRKKSSKCPRQVQMTVLTMEPAEAV